MGELKASELKYGQPLVTKIGGLLLTATNIETPSAAEYAPEGALYLNLAKLGLADEAISGQASVAGPEGAAGEAAATTPLPIFAWSTPMVTGKTLGEEATQVAVAFVTSVNNTKGKLTLRIYGGPAVANIKEPLVEPKTATKAVVSLCSCTVFCIGK